MALGHVLFDVAPGAAPGSFPVILSAFPTTSLANENAIDIPIDTLTSGQITITAVSAVPEPSTFAFLLVVPAAWLLRRNRRARI